MRMRFALLAVCAGTFVTVHAPMALAASKPIPGVDVIVRKNPGGNSITVGNCQSGGGKVIKIGGRWACTGLPASGKAGKALPKTGSGGKPSIGEPIQGTPIVLEHDPSGMKRGGTGNGKKK